MLANILDVVINLVNTALSLVDGLGFGGLGLGFLGL